MENEGTIIGLSNEDIYRRLMNLGHIRRPSDSPPRDMYYCTAGIVRACPSPLYLSYQQNNQLPPDMISPDIRAVSDIRVISEIENIVIAFLEKLEEGARNGRIRSSDSSLETA